MRPDISARAHAAHARATARGEATYRDPVTGHDVMTATALLARGECCGSGCRHCPYPSGNGQDSDAPSGGGDR